eukprot:TRINITY_DN4160_c0_g1_i2.p1 TRINITY_DN4160_c0_g1~~TRINITY_DN4160_c0_g1_i2.p1  ORF type:complete len:373 (-),score=19.43 TRINITY_DN4160_c0_g1_i2:58-1176(-)
MGYFRFYSIQMTVFFLLCIILAHPAWSASMRRGLLRTMPNAKPSLTDRMGFLRKFESDIKRLQAESNVPSQVPIGHRVNTKAISKEATSLLQQYGETLEYYHLKRLDHDVDHGMWTCLSLKSRYGDACDDGTDGRTTGFKLTPVWHKAYEIRNLLAPIEPALERVRLSVMHPGAMVSWHCDNCPRRLLGNCPTAERVEEVRRSNESYHDWVRLHLVLTDSQTHSGIGAEKMQGTKAGSFFLANVAMPHRVDNKGNSTRVVLLVDVRVTENRPLLLSSALGRQILKAVDTVKAFNGADVYLRMLQSLYEYKCKLGDSTRAQTDTELHYYNWPKPYWQPLPSFTPKHFNGQGRCGIFGPTENLALFQKRFGGVQ